VDLLEQVAVPVEEGAVDGGGAGDAGDADLGSRGCGLVDGGDDPLAAPCGVSLPAGVRSTVGFTRACTPQGAPALLRQPNAAAQNLLVMTAARAPAG
jgi:hypothetical protein